MKPSKIYQKNSKSMSKLTSKSNPQFQSYPSPILHRKRSSLSQRGVAIESRLLKNV